MKNSLISLSVIAAAMVTAQVAVAQDADPKNRADVKAEAAAANKAGEAKTLNQPAAVVAPKR